MRSNYKKIGDYIQKVNVRNTDLLVTDLLGINIDNFFMPSVANVVGTDMSKYKIVKNRQFSCNRMHVGRDYRIPISMSTSKEDFLVSPAYDVFEVKNEEELLPEYLMMWFSRKEYDRNAWFYTDADVRGGLHWDAFCDIEFPLPSIEKQREIVKEYNVVKDRIELNNTLIQKLEETAQAIYKQWFVDFEFPDENGNPYKSSGGEMEWCDELDKDVPKGWEAGNIGSYSKVNSGFAFKSIWWKEEGVPVIKIGSIFNNTIDYNALAFVDDDKIKKAINYKAKEGGIVIAMTGATIGKIGLVPKINETILVNQRVGLFNLGENPLEKAPFLYLTLLDDFTQNEIQNVGGDSAQANISNTQIEKISIILPNHIILKKFNKILLPNFQMILNKIDENNKLSQSTDILLSKLSTVNN